MKRDHFGYSFFNIAVLLVTACVFIFDYADFLTLFCPVNLLRIDILVIAVFLVHAIKAFRLYIALYGSEITFSKYMQVYCKVTPVSMVFPFKLGEFFRMYCYGRAVGNVLKGIVIVILDRVMDTAALLTTILLVWLFAGGKITVLVYLLIIFLVLSLMIFALFPGVCNYWKKNVLYSKATKGKLKILKMLKNLELLYCEIKNVSKGRGAILFFMSLFAWGVEIGSVAVIERLLGKDGFGNVIADYLTAAMGTGKCNELRQFVFVSVIMLIMVYVLFKVFHLFQKKVDE